MKASSVMTLAAAAMAAAFSGSAFAAKANANKVTVSYACEHAQAKKLDVTYTFKNDKAVSATVKVNKKSIGKLNVDKNYHDLTNFVSKRYVLGNEPNLTPALAKQADSVMLTKKGKDADQILAKNCKIVSAR